MDLTKFLACPSCGNKINILKTEWTCSVCANRWPIDSDGVLRMTQDDYSFSADRREMEDLLAELRTIPAGSLEIEKERLEKRYKDFDYDYCLNPWRADWTYLGNFSNKTIMDLGCGYGGVSIPVAGRQPRSQISVDLTLERVKFLSIVAKKRGVKGIIPVHGNALHIPVSPGSIDSVMMVGLLEYAAGFYHDKNIPAGERQVNFLKNVRSILSDLGEVWVGIENQLSPIHFFGRTYHGEIPFTPLLPKWLANLIHLKVRKKPYETLLWTRQGYRRLFHAAGLENARIYYAFPNYKNPRFISSTDQKAVISHYLANRAERTRKQRIILRAASVLDKARLAGIFCPSFFIKASSATPPKEAAMLAHVQNKWGFGKERDIDFVLQSGGRAERGFATFFFYSEGRPFMVGKIPRNKHSETLEREYNALKTVRKHLRDNEVAKTLENPLELVEIDETPILFKDYKEGIRADRYLLSGNRTKRATQVLEALTAWYIRYLEGMKDFHIRSVNEKARVVQGLIGNSPMPLPIQEWVENESRFLAPSHGDLVLSNVLIKDSRVSGVLDFENFDMAGVPAVDFLGILVSTGTTIFGLNEEMIEKSFFERNPFSVELLRCIQLFCRHFQRDVRAFLGLTPLYSGRAKSLSRRWRMEEFERFHRLLASKLSERSDQVLRLS